jgi:hypothetical protein
MKTLSQMDERGEVDVVFIQGRLLTIGQLSGPRLEVLSFRV